MGVGVYHSFIILEPACSFSNESKGCRVRHFEPDGLLVKKFVLSCEHGDQIAWLGKVSGWKADTAASFNLEILMRRRF